MYMQQPETLHYKCILKKCVEKNKNTRSLLAWEVKIQIPILMPDWKNSPVICYRCGTILFKWLTCMKNTTTNSCFLLVHKITNKTVICNKNQVNTKNRSRGLGEFTEWCYPKKSCAVTTKSHFQRKFFILVTKIVTKNYACI